MRSFALLCLLLLASCGFRPVHAPVSDPYEATLPFVQIEKIDAGRPGQILQMELEDLFHPDGQYPQPRHRLAVTLTQAKQPIVIESNARVSRYNVLFTADYRLIDLLSGATVHQGKVSRQSSYNASLSDFSTYVAEGDAFNRGVKQIAKDVTGRVTAHLKKSR
jgi:LPS-assembly lipoprotein